MDRPVRGAKLIGAAGPVGRTSLGDPVPRFGRARCSWRVQPSRAMPGRHDDLERLPSRRLRFGAPYPSPDLYPGRRTRRLQVPHALLLGPAGCQRHACASCRCLSSPGVAGAWRTASRSPSPLQRAAPPPDPGPCSCERGHVPADRRHRAPNRAGPGSAQPRKGAAGCCRCGRVQSGARVARCRGRCGARRRAMPWPAHKRILAGANGRRLAAPGHGCQSPASASSPSRNIRGDDVGPSGRNARRGMR